MVRTGKRGQRTRPIVVPRFGARLTALRETITGRSQEAISRLLKGRYGLLLGRSTLSQYEGGTVAAPDAAVLWGLAHVYDTSLDDLAGLLVAERTGRIVTAHPRGGASGAQSAGHAPTEESRMPDDEVFYMVRGAWAMVPVQHRHQFAVHIANYAASLAAREATGTAPKE